jgi:hypothetical protein
VTEFLAFVFEPFLLILCGYTVSHKQFFSDKARFTMSVVIGIILFLVMLVGVFGLWNK